MNSPDWNAIAADCGCIRIACLRPEDISEGALAACLENWQSSGNLGTLSYIDSRIDLLARPFKERPWARCALVVSFAPERDLDSKILLLPQAKPHEPVAFIASYALNEDYHITGHRKLAAITAALASRAPGDSPRFECCIDSIPVMEKQLARLGHIGVQGRNSLIRDDENGCRLHLGVVFTSLDFPSWRPHQTPGGCGDCTRCIAACPNHVFGEGNFNVSACRAWLASEYRRPLDARQQKLLGNVLLGCGLCTTSCPSAIPSAPPFRVSPERLLAMPTRELSPIIKDTILERTGVTILKRNAAAALANQLTASAWETVKPRLLECSNSPTVQQTIQWADAK